MKTVHTKQTPSSTHDYSAIPRTPFEYRYWFGVFSHSLPFCAMLLADSGADVVKVERAAGDAWLFYRQG